MIISLLMRTGSMPLPASLGPDEAAAVSSSREVNQTHDGAEERRQPQISCRMTLWRGPRYLTISTDVPIGAQ